MFTTLILLWTGAIAVVLPIVAMTVRPATHNDPFYI